MSESRHGNEEPAYLRGTSTPSIRTHAALALLTVIVQIALGGWVSTNYAALACTDFPTCNGVWLPEMDFSHAYRIVRELGQTADGEPLSYAALTAIHWTHRLGALVVTLVAGSLAARLLMSPAWRRWGMLLGVALLAQITLGISAVPFLPAPLRCRRSQCRRRRAAQHHAGSQPEAGVVKPRLATDRRIARSRAL